MSLPIIETINTNIANLKQTKQDIKNAINIDFNKITNEQIEDYADLIIDTEEEYKSRAHTEDFEDSSITINNSAPFELRNSIIKGNTEQETLTGANLMKYEVRTNTTSGATYTCDEKGQVTITGTATTYVGLGYNLASTYLNLTAGTYKLKIIGNATGIEFSRNNYYTITLDNNQEATITLDSDVDNLQIMQHINAGTYNCNYYITLASGTTATTERYCGGIPSPNPRLRMPY